MMECLIFLHEPLVEIAIFRIFVELVECSLQTGMGCLVGIAQ